MTHTPASRRLAGFGAMAATAPYITLKLIWVFGGTLGVTGATTMAALRTANIATIAMDLIVLLAALALTMDWGLRLPTAVVIVPMWLATGMLAHIVAIAPALPLLLADSQPDGFLEPWVYAVVYGGFTLQGLLVIAAFVLYTRTRWPAVWSARNLGTSTDAVATGLSVVICALAAGIAVAHAAGVTADRFVVVRVAHVVAGVAAALGVVWLVGRRPSGRPVAIPLAMAWLGAGASFTWGCWTLLTLGARFAATGDPAQFVGHILTTVAQVVLGVLAAVTTAYQVTQRGLGGSTADTVIETVQPHRQGARR